MDTKATETKLQKGDLAPDFTLESSMGRQSLADYRGQWLVLYFYPKDDTPGCTAEACDFRDLSPNLGAQVLGVSADDLTSHDKFAAKYSLNFPLVYDEGYALARTYGAYGEKNVGGQAREGIIRSTFIIDPAGKIAAALYGVNAAGHAQEVAELLEQLRPLHPQN